MKITVIGGGSTYTPELVNGFLAAVDSLPLKELWLMDIDQERLDDCWRVRTEDGQSQRRAVQSGAVA